MNWKKQTKKNNILQEPLPECHCFTTGRVDPLRKKSRLAVKFIMKQPGFIGVNVPNGDISLWIFDTLNNAKRARNNCEAVGIICGNHIIQGRYDPPTGLTVTGKAD